MKLLPTRMDLSLQRLLGAAALGIMLHLGVSGGAQAQSREGRQLDEIVRKAEKGERENGFCATTGWPPGDNLEWFTQFLRGSRVGSWKVNYFANGNCQLDRVTLIVPENDGRCITYRLYACTQGGTCGTGQVTDCLDRNGTFVKRRE